MGMRSVVSIVCIALSLGLLGAATDATAPGAAKGASGLPLPRFSSLKSKRVNMRIGPSTDYAVSWMYLKSGMPVEIIQEYENWRRIRDADGTEGWVNQALLSGERTAVAAPWMRGKGKEVYVNMRREAQSGAAVVARLEPGVVFRIGEGKGEIWGAYPGEAFK